MKKIVSLGLTASVLFSTIPLYAMAAEPQQEDVALYNIMDETGQGWEPLSSMPCI